MYRAFVLPLVLLSLGVTHAAETDLDQHLKQIREASSDARPAALREAARAVQQLSSISKEQLVGCAALLAEARLAVDATTKSLSAAGWALAIPLVSTANPVRPEDAAWFLDHVDVAWEARTTDDEVNAAIQAAINALYSGNTETLRIGRTADRTLKKFLGQKGEPKRFLALAIGLARAPTERARSRLARALPRKGMPDKDVTLLLKALSDTGGTGAAPIFLDYVPGSAATVLETALIGLSKLDPMYLRKHGKEILSVTMKDNENHYRVMLALSNKSKLSRKEQATKDLLAARAKAWITEKIIDTPPMAVPSGIGVRGTAALWWKTIDALKGKLRAPKPPKDARPPYMNGRPNMLGQAWYLWWRSAR